MRPVRARETQAPALPVPVAPRGPGPSKLAYRLRRIWAKPWVRGLATVYVPLVALGLAGWRVAADDDLRRAVEARVASAWESIAARREFALEGVRITGVEGRRRAEVHRALGIPKGTSSLDVSVTELRGRVEALGGIARARVRLDPKGVLHVEAEPREPVALFRRADGRLFTVDRDGVVIAEATRRAAHPELPVLIGAGALSAVEEALALVAQGPEIVPRLRALVRMGERRWDLVLADDRRIMLPEAGAVTALARVMALHYGAEILDRDIAAIDMRLPSRPTLRLTGDAIETMRLHRAVRESEGEDT